MSPSGAPDVSWTLDHREQGIIVHAVLEATDFAWDMAVYRVAVRKQAESMGITLSDALENELAGHAHRFQESRMGREVREALVQGREVWREWPFWLRIDDDGMGRGPVTLSGVVDLFYVNVRGEGVLVDYKLFRPYDGTAYERQVELYARALRNATGFGGTIRTELRYLSE
jgi:ATP-dependent exoDNAse (exonuclease V) beta subunit